MKNSKALFHEIISAITLEESRDEIESIAYVVLADLFGLSKGAVMAGTEMNWTDDDSATLEDAIARINNEEPVQYVAGIAMFFGRRFFVDPAVLIPRPETEELVALVLDHARATDKESCRILDIGTGTGCIPVTCAAELPEAEVMATDVSEDALAMARKNALLHKVPVKLLLHDILSRPLPFQDLDIVVSNPPYIPVTEIRTMRRNVVSYEPHLALFVPDEDPLLFYREIAGQALGSLKPGGALFFETHEGYAGNVAEHLRQCGYANVVIHADMSGKQRIVKAQKKIG